LIKYRADEFNFSHGGLESKGNLIRHHEQQANGTAAAKIKGS